MTQLDLPLIRPASSTLMAAAAAAAQHFNATITAEMKVAATSGTTFSPAVNRSSPVQKPTHQKSISDVSGISVITPDFTGKPEKNKPHLCETCNRSFARLEHLKRHERSHTKEKPYTCPTCTRSFARRDLLLRHQQKLHSDITLPAKPRVRRESNNSISDSKARVRKPSTVNGSPNLNRPRANTMSHIDTAAFGNLAQSPKSGRGRPALQHRPSDVYAASQNMMAHAQQNANMQQDFFDPRNGLRLQTQNLMFANSLRTAPAGQEMEWPSQTPDTIDPSQLHFINGPLSAPLDSPLSPSRAGAFSDISQMTMVEDESWRNFGGELALMNTNETAIEASSPSAGSSDFFDINDLGIDRVMSHTQNPISWPEPLGNKGLPSYLLDLNNGYGSDLAQSPSALPDLMDSGYLGPEATFGVPQNDMFGSILANSMHSAEFSPKVGTHSRSASVTSSVSHVSSCLDSITDAAREILQNNLVPVGPQLVTSRRSPSMGSPGRTGASSMTVLPSTADLKKFVSAYMQYFHPHLPFLHLPTLSFDSPHFAGMRFASQQSGMAGGGGCLMLAMAAIGAQYCFEPIVAGELFELSRRKVQLYLEECRQVELAHAHHGNAGNQPQTPLWLVQTTMLNVVFGVNCADKINEQIASTHCAALVQLAQSAQLDAPSHFSMDMHMHSQEGWEATLNGDGASAPWFAWKAAEEKKRTLYGVFILSSMLTSAYNVPATLANSQIQADLPCGEKLWAASCAREWNGFGGANAFENQCIPFSDALARLLNAKHTQPERRDFASLPAPEFHASTFGCLVLINALHNFIYDTRLNKEGAWTLQDTERLCHHVEPALIQWQAVWAATPYHSMQRPNPSGMGPLSADCVPLLDLAYVRLHVSLGSSKEAFWSRRYDDMARELANGMIDADPNGYDPTTLNMSGALNAPNMREISLRTAAFHSMHSLEMSSQLNVTFADFDSRELPLQAAMCTFDCIEVVAEWVTTLQERVGRFIGLIGRDHIDLDAAIARGIIDTVDKDLILKIDALLGDADQKVGLEAMVAMEAAQERKDSVVTMQRQFSHMRAHSSSNIPTVRSPSPLPLKLNELHECGYGAKLLVVVGKMFNKSVIWPVYGLFHKCLLAQAFHMKGRAERSLVHANLN